MKPDIKPDIDNTYGMTRSNILERTEQLFENRHMDLITD